MTNMKHSLVFFSWIFAALSGSVSSACPPSYVTIDDGCYMFIDTTNVKYLDARQICQNHYGDLAVINDCDQLQSIVNYIYDHDKAHPQGYWIGASDVINDTVWTWLDGSPVKMGAPFWAGGDLNATAEPNGRALENCTAMVTSDGLYMHDVRCAEPALYSPMCEVDIIDNVTGLCPHPYVNVLDKCLQFVSHLTETFEDARTVCGVSAGDLAIIDDCYVMELVINYIIDNGLDSTAGYWIGGIQYTIIEGSWTWIDGSPMTMGVPFWGQDNTQGLQPSNNHGEECLELASSARYRFNDEKCFALKAPLCQAMPL